ncbi:hypothetical protein [Cohnella thailandensis]|uniref:Uncharacterized protein n=1 Tax=Cohnella thailandensis TaxID=557557 RepID=A0A841T5I6_9BACL|nr:hypothetical protein [Cohnella thailandensis]MBB6638229.1 hypothetical protein [Cohnella thailandensis]MBP1977790.1 hypothetical protein [Cohnella thailandensis]
MANKKGIKWIVGLSGAALYSILIGYISHQDAGTASASSVPTVTDPAGQSDQDSLMQQWESESGGRHGRGSFGESTGGTYEEGGSMDNSAGGGLQSRGS